MKTNQSEKVQANRQRKMAEIRSTALQIILELGLERLSMHEVARRRNVTVGALYRYYESKQSLVVTLEFECLESVRDALAKVDLTGLDSTDPVGYAQSSLGRIIDVYRQNLNEHPAHERLISGILATPLPVVGADDRNAAVQKMFEALAVPIHHLEHLSSIGAFTEGKASDRALILWVMVHGILQLKKMEVASGDMIRIDALLRTGLNSLVRGWCKQ